MREYNRKILKTKILFEDISAEKYGIKEDMIWGDFWLNLEDVAGFGEFVKDNIAFSEFTEATIKHVGGRVLNIPVKEFKKLMIEVWGEW